MRSRSNSGGAGRGADRAQAHDPQRDCSRGAPELYIVGIGPGSLDHLTLRATEVLQSVDWVAGYSLYLDLIQPLIEGKETLRSGMMKEVERVEASIDMAMSGRACALVSSGDPGIYAMAGLVLEACRTRNISLLPPQAHQSGPNGGEGLRLEVVPGVPALCAGAALLGAPLTHDFAVVSLSDLLTPWAVIAERLEAAARADFVIVLYNPKSKKRDWQLSKAREILLAHRDPETPVGVVAGAMRPNQDVRIVSLRDLDPARIDMQTTVFIGSRASSRYLHLMFTPRGYAGKYNIRGPVNPFAR